MTKRLGLVTLLLLLFWQVKAQHQLNGYVRDAKSGEALIGANIWQPSAQHGTTTNQFGYYSLSLKGDTATVHVSYVGYKTEKAFLKLNADSTLNFRLSMADELEEVTVKGTRPGVELTKMSSMTIKSQEIKNIPALLGEVDVLKAIQLMPGVQSGSEGSSGIYVRGGGPDQNLILMDGVPVYNASHLFGFFSVFNADAINNVEVIKGGFPARYGGRLSSVIDINMKEGNMNNWQADGGIGLISSKLSVEGPIIKDKASIILSGRRTYIDLLARPLIKMSTDSDVDLGYFFYDFNGKANYIISDKDRVYVSAYTGTDKFYALDKSGRDVSGNDYWEDESGIYWGNVTTAARWNHLINNKLFLNTTATFSKYGFNIFNDSYSRTVETDTTYEYDFYAAYNSGIRDYSIRADFDYFPNNRHAIKFGTQYIYHIFQPEAFNVDEGLYEEADLPDVKPVYGNEYMFFVEDDYTLNDKIKLNVGLNASAFYVNKKLYNSLQPRLSARYLIDKSLSVKASYAEMSQFLHLLTNSGIGLPTDLWVPATDNIKPQRSRQLAVGIHKSLKDDVYELSSEAYYKTMDNLIEYREGANFLEVSNDWESKVTSGRGWAYGAEFLARKNTGKVTGWVGYTLSWNNRQFDELNFGKIYPYKYDRRHDLSVVLNFKFSDKFEMNTTWVYGTGNAITIPTAIYPQLSPEGYDNYGYYEEVYQYSDRNAYRMPAYHRADIGFSWHKEKKWGERTWSLGVYNAYNRQNPFFIQTYTKDDGSTGFEQLSIFQFIPSISYSFKVRPNAN